MKTVPTLSLAAAALATLTVPGLPAGAQTVRAQTVRAQATRAQLARAAPARAVRDGGDDTRCAYNPTRAEPLLVHDVTGSTLLGMYHHHLAIYSDGTASLSRLDPLEHPTGQILVRRISQEGIALLRDRLLLAGVNRMCDDTVHLMDAPMATLTVFEALGAGVESRTLRYAPGLHRHPWRALELALAELVAVEFSSAPGPRKPVVRPL